MISDSKPENEPQDLPKIALVHIPRETNSSVEAQSFNIWFYRRLIAELNLENQR